MKPDHSFIAERPLARHCPELLAAGPDHGELLALLARAGERLGRRLAGALAPLLGGEAPTVRCLVPREGTLRTIHEEAPHGLAANSLFAIGPGAAPLLVTLDAAAVFRIVDRAFGGKGAAPRPLPEAFPMAADLMILRLEAMLAAHITGAVDAVTDGSTTIAATGSRAIVATTRDGDLAQLAPFAPDQSLAIVTLDVKEADTPPWRIMVALPVTALPALFGLASAAPPVPRIARRAADAMLVAPFADLPLTLSARIVDMVLPFARVAALRPGQILPVSPARSVPLRAAEQTIAHGTIGAIDDCVALQITTAFGR